MSGHQDVNNPFGDPDINPFADPYVALAANENKDASLSAPITAASHQVPPPYTSKPPEYASTMPPSQSAIQSDPTYYQPKPFSTETQPGTLQGIHPVFPGQSNQAQAAYSSAPQQMNQVELERKANELEAREQELNRRQKIALKQNNFPPLPSFCPWKSCYFHDITVEIPVSGQKTCKIMFYLWQFYVLTLIVNLISCLALLVGGGSDADTAGTTFGISLIFMFANIPCSFVFWYRPIYKALRDDSSFNYMVFFFVFLFQIVFCVLCALGIPKFGTAGWINGIAQITRGNKAVAALMLITGLMWTILCIGKIFYLKRIHAAYRNSGASFEKAQGELAVGIASNKAVQNVAIESMRAGIASGSQTRN